VRCGEGGGEGGGGGWQCRQWGRDPWRGTTLAVAALPGDDDGGGIAGVESGFGGGGEEYWGGLGRKV
jgi:hypothetical protein